MNQPLTVMLPTDVQKALVAFSQREGLTPEEVVGSAVKQHLFLQEFRTLRERMSAKAQRDGINTDQDVFDRMS